MANLNTKRKRLLAKRERAAAGAADRLAKQKMALKANKAKQAKS